MTYQTNSSALRLGNSISWSAINSPLYINKSLRLNIVLNVYLKGLLRFFRIKLVKWVIHPETLYLKIGIFMVWAVYPDYYKARYKRKKFPFAKWQHYYFSKETYELKMLYNYFTSKRQRVHSRLSSGKLWHKIFKSIFFIMGVGKADFIAKRDGLFDFESAMYFEDRDKNLMLKKINVRLRSKKFINFPQMQAMYLVNFKILLAVSALFKNQLYLPTKNLNFRTKYFFNIFLINFLVDKIYFPKKLHILKKFFSKFNDTRDASLRRVPSPKDTYKKLVVPFYSVTKISGSKVFKHIQGNLIPEHTFADKPLNRRKKRNAKIIKFMVQQSKLINYLRKVRWFKKKKIYNKVFWSSLFISGFYSKKFYKKIVRKKVMSFFRDSVAKEARIQWDLFSKKLTQDDYKLIKNVERTRFFNQAIKNFVFKNDNKKLFENNVVQNRFFKRNFFNRIFLIYKKFIKINSVASNFNSFKKKKTFKLLSKVANYDISKQLKLNTYFRDIKRLKYKDFSTDTGFGISKESIWRRYRKRFSKKVFFNWNHFFAKFLLQTFKKKYYLSLYLHFVIKTIFYKKKDDLKSFLLLVELHGIFWAKSLLSKYIEIQANKGLSLAASLKRPKIIAKKFKMLNTAFNKKYSIKHLNYNLTYMLKLYFFKQIILLSMLKARFKLWMQVVYKQVRLTVYFKLVSIYFGLKKKWFGLFKSFMLLRKKNSYQKVGNSNNGFRFFKNSAAVSRKGFHLIFKYQFFKMYFEKLLKVLIHYYKTSKKRVKKISNYSFRWYVVSKIYRVRFINNSLIDSFIKKRLNFFSNKRLQSLFRFYGLTMRRNSLVKLLNASKIEKNQFLLKRLFLKRYNMFLFRKMLYKYLKKLLYFKKIKKPIYNKFSLKNRLKRVWSTYMKFNKIFSSRGFVDLKLIFAKTYLNKINFFRNLICKFQIKKMFSYLFVKVFRYLKKIYLKPVFFIRNNVLLSLKKNSLQKNSKKVLNFYKILFFYVRNRFKKIFKKLMFLFIDSFNNLFLSKKKSRNLFLVIALIKAYLLKEKKTMYDIVYWVKMNFLFSSWKFVVKMPLSASEKKKLRIFKKNWHPFKQEVEQLKIRVKYDKDSVLKIVRSLRILNASNQKININFVFKVSKMSSLLKCKFLEVLLSRLPLTYTVKKKLKNRFKLIYLFMRKLGAKTRLNKTKLFLHEIFFSMFVHQPEVGRLSRRKRAKLIKRFKRLIFVFKRFNKMKKIKIKRPRNLKKTIFINHKKFKRFVYLSRRLSGFNRKGLRNKDKLGRWFFNQKLLEFSQQKLNVEKTAKFTGTVRNVSFLLKKNIYFVIDKNELKNLRLNIGIAWRKVIFDLDSFLDRKGRRYKISKTQMYSFYTFFNFLKNLFFFSSLKKDSIEDVVDFDKSLYVHFNKIYLNPFSRRWSKFWYFSKRSFTSKIWWSRMVRHKHFYWRIMTVRKGIRDRRIRFKFTLQNKKRINKYNKNKLSRFFYLQSFYKIFHRRKQYLKNFYKKSVINYKAKKSYSFKIKKFNNFKNLLLNFLISDFRVRSKSFVNDLINNQFANILKNNWKFKSDYLFFSNLKLLRLVSAVVSLKIKFFRLFIFFISKKKFSKIDTAISLYRYLNGIKTNLIKNNFGKFIFNKDSTLFYVEKKIQKKISDGKFFEILKSKLEFFFNNDYHHVLKVFLPEIALEFNELLLYKAHFFLYLLLQKTDDTKKIIFIRDVFKKYKFLKRLLFFKKVSSLKIINLRSVNFLFCSQEKNDLESSVYFYYKLIVLVALKVYRKKNFYIRTSGSYGLRYWLRNKKFRFWLENELEVYLGFNIKLFIANPHKAIMNVYRPKIGIFFLLSRSIKHYSYMGGWRQRIIYNDIIWTFFIATKYYASSYLTDMISEQIVKREKHWPFIKRIRFILTELLNPFYKAFFRHIDGFRISINGKINGKDRAINYLFYKDYKDCQISKINWLDLKVDYSLMQADSWYGSFGIRVWISRA